MTRRNDGDYFLVSGESLYATLERLAPPVITEPASDEPAGDEPAETAAPSPVPPPKLQAQAFDIGTYRGGLGRWGK